MPSEPSHPIRRRPKAEDGAPTGLRDSARGDRLQKVLAAAGVGSRRACEELIAEGAVRVNGDVVDTLPAWVDPHEDRITVNGVGIRKPERPVYVMLYKPERVLSTTSDPEGRKTVTDLVRHPGAARLYPVGRVEYDAQGLVLLTNDGELTRKLTHASFGATRTIQCIVKGAVSEADAARLAAEISSARPGVRFVDGRPSPGAKAPKGPTGRRRTGRVTVSVVEVSEGKSVLEITLLEGRNREVERVLKECGFPVRKTIHVAMGDLTLSGVRPGEWRELTRDEVRVLRDAVDATKRSRQAAKPAPTRPKRRPAGKPRHQARRAKKTRRRRAE